MQLNDIRANEVQVYKLDREFYQKSGNTPRQPLVSSGAIPVQNYSITMEIELEPTDSIYLEANVKEKPLERPLSLGRKYHLFRDRRKNNFAYIERREQTAYLGMGDQDTAESYVGIILNNVPDKLSIIVDSNDKEECYKHFAVRIDYCFNNQFLTSVLFKTEKNHMRYENLLWGTKEREIEIRKINNLNQFDIDFQ